ncbi:MAG: helix-turn-helix transcriptional regulator [Bacilli bacterium]|nr:helix-turn-helix transcriptional regulator [Bacilli bacterium]
MEVTNEHINKTFGIIFQEYRLKHNITQEKFAEELKKSTKTISQIETRKRWYKQENGYRFYEFFRYYT